MCDEQPGSEQPAPSAPPTGNRWGDPITPERAAELQALADQQRAWAAAPDHQGRESYFKDVPLTGAEVFWLAAYALAGPDGDLDAAQGRLRTEHYNPMPDLHLENAKLGWADLTGAYLYEAHLAWIIHGAFR